jgi:type VI secretion system secreted protein Hcp
LNGRTFEGLDRSTPKLFELVTRGTRAPRAILTVRKEGADPFDYFRITLEDVLVSSLQLSAATDRPSESLSLSFGKVTVEYRPSSRQARPGPGHPRPGT